MVDSLCQGYHWSFEESMSLTLPQIIMLNHASNVNHERAERRYKAEKGGPGGETKRGDEKDPVVMGGKRLTELTTTEMAVYYGGFSRGE